MRKAGKRILGLLMAVLMIVQLSFSVLAEDLEVENIGFSLYKEETSYDTELTEIEETTVNNESIEDLSDQQESNLYEEDLTEETDLILEEADTEEEEQILEEETEERTDQAEITTLSAEEPVEEPQEIHVTISVSKDGKFLDDKDGNPMAGREITLTGQTSYTMDDALKEAHRLYYIGGTDGYDYHEDEDGIYDGIIYSLWGYKKSEVPYIRASLNRDSREYQSALSREVKDGDEMHFFIQQRKGIDSLTFFIQNEQTIAQGQKAVLRLRQYNNTGNKVTDCAGASIYVNGEKQEGLITDSQGYVTVAGLEESDTPYFITAEKLEQDSSGNMATMITAAYVNVRVLKSDIQNENYLSKVTLHMEVDEKERDISLDCLDGSQSFIVPAEMVYRHFTTKADMYVAADVADEMPDGCRIYAVYEDPEDGVERRTEIGAGNQTFLKYAIAKGISGGNDMITRNVAIDSIKIEVQRNNLVVESRSLPIVYCNHLESLSLSDAKGNKYSVDLKDSLDNQNIEIEVPENEKYVNIQARSYGYSDTRITFAFNGETKIVSNGSAYKLDLDWENHQEPYILTLNILNSGKDNISQSAEYTLTVKKGEIDYTPDVEMQIIGSEGTLTQGADSPVLKANATVLRPEEGTLSYQWYYVDRTEHNYNPSEISFDQYNKIDGATKESYYVPTDQIGNTRYYRCQVTYVIDGKNYSGWSRFASYTVVAPNIEVPEIKEQPQNIQYVQGKPMTDSFEVQLEEAPWLNLKAQYQWYKSEEKDTDSGESIDGATDASYMPEIPEKENTYYYCKIRYQRSEWNSETGYAVSYSEEICSDVVSVTMLNEAMPWEGTGSEKEPYLISNLEDLKNLHDKVNNDGYAFDRMHFKMTADISLSSDWKPIGSIAQGKTLTEDGKNLWAFSGIFDGNVHTLTVADGGKPLFNYVREAVVENLKLAGRNINGYGLVDRYTVDYGVDGNYNTGCPDTITIRNVTLTSGMSTKKAGLIGGYASGANDVVIENCTAEAGVIIGYTKQEGSIGTFAGSINGVIRNCHSEATVYGTNAVGGLAGSKGQSMGACTVENSSFTGNVIATGNWIGGILGKGYEADSAPNTPVASVKNCYVAGNVSGASNVGGIFGGEPSCKQCWGNGSGAIANNFFYGTVSGSSNVGAIIGYMRSFDKFQGISNNYFLNTCGASQGIGGIETVLTVSGNPQDVPYEYDNGYGIDYKFEQNLYCFPRTAEEFRNGTVKNGLNSGNYNNWEQGSDYPVYGQAAYATGLTLTGNYKKEYYLGEELDFSGGTFTVTWSDGTKTHPEAKEIVVIGYDPNKRGSQMLSLKYGAVETTITVGVILRSGQIEVSFTLLGDYVHDSDSDQNYHTLSSQNLETWIPETKMIVSNNAKVKDVLEQALSTNGMTCENATGNYVSAITRNGVKLSEFTNGRNSGWMYTLNGKHPDLGVNEQYLNSGDVIIFHYTDNYVEEEHVHQWSDSWSSNGVVHWHECEWDCGQRKDQASHSWSAWQTTQAATYTSAEVQTRHCTVCGREQTQNVGSPLTPPSPEPAPKPNPTMKVNVSKITLKYGQSTTGLKVTGLQSGDYVQSYKSSNTAIFTVTGNGKITAKKKSGSATLTITLKSGLSGKVTVTVQKGTVKTTKISGVAKKVTIVKGKKYTVKPVLTPFTSQEKVTYTSSNKKVAAVSSKGVITAKKAGTAKITVKSGKKKAVITVTVPKTATKSISVASSVSVKKGKTYTLKAKRIPADSGEKITYTSSNKKIATVTDSGKIKGIKKGTATITVKSGKISKKVKVTVK